MILSAGRSSAVGNPFACSGGQHDVSVHAFDDWLALVLWSGLTNQLDETGGLIAAVGRKHGLEVRPDIGPRYGHAAWEWLRAAALAGVPTFVEGDDGDDLGAVGRPSCAVDCVAGAVEWLRQRMTEDLTVDKAIEQRSGDWAVAHIFQRWPPDVAAELASFAWPITDARELRRLCDCPHASPRAIVAFEFTAAIRGAYEEHWGFKHVAISADLRRSLQPGPHVCMDIREVLGVKRWHDAFLHPPCTHQVRSDATSSVAKHLDGRTFWGIALFVYSWCVDARRVMVEQPATVIPDHYLHPTQRVRPCDVGDTDNKPIHLFERGGRMMLQRDPLATGQSGHKRLRDFSGAEERDRWRSSWARFPKLCRAVVAAVDEEAADAGGLIYAEEIERFACSWHDAGLPVPEDYAAPDAQPALPEDRAYQSVRGRGDGRRVVGVLPNSRRSALSHQALPHAGGPAPHPSHAPHTVLLAHGYAPLRHSLAPSGDGTLCLTQV